MTRKEGTNILHRFVTQGSLMVSAIAIVAGCTPSPTEVDPFSLPDCNDLEILSPSIFEMAGAGSDNDDIIESNEPFIIRWTALYHKGTDSPLAGTGDYRGSVTIMKNGDEVFFAEFDAVPLGISGGDWDEFHVEEGLPPGTYSVTVALDIDNVVEECDELPFLLNNVRERELVVEFQPIDDVASPTGESPQRDPSDSTHGGLPGQG